MSMEAIMTVIFREEMVILERPDVLGVLAVWCEGIWRYWLDPY